MADYPPSGVADYPPSGVADYPPSGVADYPPFGVALGSTHAATPRRRRAVVASHVEGEALELSKRNATGYTG